LPIRAPVHKLRRTKPSVGEAMNYDAFISHASEDKKEFVAPLADRLRARGLKVWYDSFTLKLGDSLTDAIGRGIVSSRYGLVVISPNFVVKPWARRELSALVAREDGASKVILPIWHNISKQEVLAHVPLLADRVAADSREGFDSVVEKILEVISPERVAEESVASALAYEQQGRFGRAWDYFVEALHIDRDNEAAISGMGRMLALRRGNVAAVKKSPPVVIAPIEPPIQTRYPIETTPAVEGAPRRAVGTGVVKWFNDAKGFGFIVDDDSKEQVFVHHSAILIDGFRTLVEGQKVEFNVRQGPKHLQAQAVRPIA